MIRFTNLLLRHLKVQRIFSSSDGQVSNLISFSQLLAFSKGNGGRIGEKAEGGTLRAQQIYTACVSWVALQFVECLIEGSESLGKSPVALQVLKSDVDFQRRHLMSSDPSSIGLMCHQMTVPGELL